MVKQVPSTDQVKIDDETGTMIREGVEAEINPLDLYAVEEAVRIKERAEDGVEITVVSMGPPAAMQALRSALAMGCDKACLLSDRKFGGADTWATSYALMKGIEALGPFDLILCGERATDGETGQVGPGVAAQFDIPVLAYVSAIDNLGDGSIVAQRAIEGGHEVVEAPLPALLTFVKEINEPRIPSLRGKLAAKKVEIPVLTAEQIGAEEDKIGLKSSPTRVVKVFYPTVTRKGKVVSGEDAGEAVTTLLEFLREKNFV
jgi:electron transfer flavoprotein beta subunit